MCSFGEWLHGLKSVGDFASYNGFRKTHVVYLLVKWSNQKKQTEGQFILTQYVSNLYDHFWVGVICSTCVLIMLHRTYFSETMPQTFPGYTGNFPFIYLSLLLVLFHCRTSTNTRINSNKLMPRYIVINSWKLKMKKRIFETVRKKELFI